MSDMQNIFFYFDENKPQHFAILKYVDLKSFSLVVRISLKKGGGVKFSQTQTSQTCMQQLHNRKLH